MDEQRSFLRSIPLGTWIGLVALAVMAIVTPFRPYVVFAAVIVILYTAYECWRWLSELDRKSVV